MTDGVMDGDWGGGPGDRRDRQGDELGSDGRETGAVRRGDGLGLDSEMAGRQAG